MSNENKNKEKKICKEGEVLTLNGDCMKLEYNTETQDTDLTLKKNCKNPDAIEMFAEIGVSLAGDKGKFNVNFSNED